jgi:hypothetical protein
MPGVAAKKTTDGHADAFPTVAQDRLFRVMRTARLKAASRTERTEDRRNQFSISTEGEGERPLEGATAASIRRRSRATSSSISFDDRFKARRDAIRTIAKPRHVSLFLLRYASRKSRFIRFRWTDPPSFLPAAIPTRFGLESFE